MAYTLEAVIGAAAVLQPVPGAVAVELGAGLSLVPITDELFDAVTDRSTEGPLGFWRLPPGFDRVLAGWSVAGPVAYVEAEYFGGVGEQRAALWDEGRLVFGPVSADVGPISQVLARLGVERNGHQDEFDSVGLDRHRHTEGWLS